MAISMRQHPDTASITTNSVVPMAVLRTSTLSNNRVRSKFLQKIGIHPTPNKDKAPNVSSIAGRSVRDLSNVPRLNEPLHYAYNHLEEKDRREPRESKQKKGVNFQETVTVALIPMRTEYSRRIRTKIWIDQLELSQNAERNLVEFAAEGYDWQSACTERHMYFCEETKELIHPVHIGRQKR
mmetsp:Transcript_36661/g.76933  ORF Transcript_36661/g.76933 Transcript_36661/m.76933 type:complete len:182 (-) Transcript_36661:219-764(-)